MNISQNFDHIVILTGAGISAESGIKTFRDQNGLWEDHAIEDVASPEGFKRNPQLVYDFYNQRRKQLLSTEVQPNIAHQALAKLQGNAQGQVRIITQNVDNLHERAGSKEVIHMHGELLKMRCQRTSLSHQASLSFDSNTPCPCCQKTNSLRPDIVWFGEMPMHMQKIQEHLEKADLFLSIGTSGHVYPAAMFVQLVPERCVKIEINTDETNIGEQFDHHLKGPASIEVPKLINSLLGQKE